MISAYNYVIAFSLFYNIIEDENVLDEERGRGLLTGWLSNNISQMLKKRLAGIITFPAAAFISHKNKPVIQTDRLSVDFLLSSLGCGAISEGGFCLDIHDIQDVKHN